MKYALATARITLRRSEDLIAANERSLAHQTGTPVFRVWNHLLLPDVMAIADEVDAQLTQTMGSYMKTDDATERTKVGDLSEVNSRLEKTVFAISGAQFQYVRF
jgi:hypothetical protein